MSKIYLDEFPKLKFNTRINNDKTYYFTTKDLINEHLIYWNKYLDPFTKKKKQIYLK
jgi:hypothetical protein